MSDSDVAALPRSMSSEQRMIEEIRRFLGADSVGYLSLESLRAAVGDKDEQFCTSCYTGNYPTELVQLETAAHRDG
jgi:amidophosphoribosyltransferase